MARIDQSKPKRDTADSSFDAEKDTIINDDDNDDDNFQRFQWKNVESAISDEKETSYGHFSGFLSHKIEISRKKNILGTSLGKSKTTHVAK